MNTTSQIRNCGIILSLTLVFLLKYFKYLIKVRVAKLMRHEIITKTNKGGKLCEWILKKKKQNQNRSIYFK